MAASLHAPAFASPSAVFTTSAGAGASNFVAVRHASQRAYRRRMRARTRTRVARPRMTAAPEEESISLVGKSVEESKSLISDSTSGGGAGAGGAGASADVGAAAASEEGVAVELSPEEQKAAAIREKNEKLRAAERFVTVDEGNWLCITCGYLYEPSKGERLCDVAPGTAFEDVDELFACPVCKSPKRKFRRKPKTLAGFAANQKYGLGGNSMTGGQKNLLIFGGLAFFILLLLSGYLLD